MKSMLVKFNRKELIEKLSRLSGVVKRASNVLPMCDMALIRVSGLEAKIMTSNLEVQLEYLINYEASEVFEFAIDFDLLIKTVRLLSEDTVPLQYDGKACVTISSVGRVYTIPAVESKGFAILQPPKESKFTIVSTELAETIKMAAKFSRVDEVDIRKGSVLISTCEDIVNVAATDVGKCGYFTIYTDQEDMPESDVIIPKQLAVQIGLIEKDEEVSLSWDDRSIVVSSGHLTITSKTLEFKHFDMDSIVQAIPGNKIVVNVMDLIMCLKRIAIYAGLSNITTLILDDTLTFKTKGGLDAREASENMDYTGNAEYVATGVKCNDFIVALSCITTDEVEIFLDNAQSPIYVRNTDLQASYTGFCARHTVV